MYLVSKIMSFNHSEFSKLPRAHSERESECSFEKQVLLKVIQCSSRITEVIQMRLTSE